MSRLEDLPLKSAFSLFWRCNARARLSGTIYYTDADLSDNSLLRSLDAETIGRLQLQPIQLPLWYDLEVPGQPINHLFFLRSGIAFMTIKDDRLGNLSVQESCGEKGTRSIAKHDENASVEALNLTSAYIYCWPISGALT